ncbi:MAG: phosphoribosyl-ATP diphosphatase [Candidatus Oxydemutatoraceae bacterium WSBS_2016_MAG_OTU14]
MGEGVLEKITAVLKARKHSTAQESYVASLYAQGTAGIGAKVMEEAEEVCVAAEHESGQALSHEVADLWFHTMVLLEHKDVSLDDVLAQLEQRFGVSGHEEKQQRGKPTTT